MIKRWASRMLLSSIAGLALGAEDKPVVCNGAKPYVGSALYAGDVDLPPAQLGISDAFDAATIARLDDAVNRAQAATKTPVISVAVANAQGRWQATRAIDGSVSTQRLYWASAGKSFTAVVILQLVQEGKLSLSDPLSRWLPKFPNAAAITIDQLLLHTAGTFSHNEDLRLRAAPRYHTPAESIAVSAKHGALFCPGERWRYSNTGYVILGQIIETLDRKPYHEVVRARILVPLGLRSLESLAPQAQPNDVASLTPSDGSKPVHQPSWGYAAGNVVGSADEMLTYWRALLTGKLLNAETMPLLFQKLYPMFDAGTYYGRGVMLYVIPDGPRTVNWLGHSGGTPGAKALVAYAPSEQAFVAVALTGDGSAEATANLLLKQLRPIAINAP